MFFLFGGSVIFFWGGEGYEWWFFEVFWVFFGGVETERRKSDMEKNPLQRFLDGGFFGVVWDCPSGLKAE